MKRIILVLKYIAALFLLTSYLAAVVSLAVFWPIALIGLLYPLLLLLNILFVAYWILRRQKYFWISVVFIAVGWTHHSRIIHWNKTKDGTEAELRPAGSKFKLMSYNVRLFDLYNWRSDKNKVTRDKIFDFIKSESADVLLLQEFFVDDTKYFRTLDTMLLFLDTRNYHVEYTTSLRGNNHWGIATFSRFPIVNRGKVEFSEKSNNICIYTDIVVNKDTLRVYNSHLASIHFNYEEYDLIQKIGGVGYEGQSRDSSGKLGNSEQIKGISDEDVSVIDVSLKMVDRLKIAFVKRAKQAEQIAEHIAKSPYKNIHAGDFNDTPTSYTYGILVKDRVDAFVNSGNGLGSTYSGKLPSYRIDYILHDAGLSSRDFKTITSNELSDHYPLSCWFTIN